MFFYEMSGKDISFLYKRSSQLGTFLLIQKKDNYKRVFLVKIQKAKNFILKQTLFRLSERPIMKINHSAIDQKYIV